MNNELKQEIKHLIKELDLNCKIEGFKNKMTKDMWNRISWNEKLSESFMEEYFDALDKYEISRCQVLSESFMEEHFDELDKYEISRCQVLSEHFMEKHFDELDKIGLSWSQKLSESFMEKHFNELDKRGISWSQKLSESFMEEHFNKLNKYEISRSQILSESFMEEHFDALDKGELSWNQKLSESFMEKHFNELDRRGISRRQKLSESFMEKHEDELDIEVQLKKHHAEKSNSAVYDYARKHNLKIENGYLYAFRNHDKFGRGFYSRTIFYEKGGVYRDWHCDLEAESENSFGLGIWPCGNTPVRIKLEDFGVEVVNNTWNGKARVWGFEVL